MQTHVQVITTSVKSLRNVIINDPKLEEFFYVTEKQQHGRVPGWAKLRSVDSKQGTVQIEWDANTKILLCRIINKAKGRPDKVLGDLIQYLVGRFKKQIHIINIIPQK